MKNIWVLPSYINYKGKVSPVLKDVWGSGVRAPPFLTLALDEGE
jgi:hypothetical protein